MRIVTIDHLKYDFGDGLAPIKLDRLSKVIVLAGPNGAGKTRLIRRINRLKDTSTDTRGNPSLRRQFGDATLGTQRIRVSVSSDIETEGRRFVAESLGVEVTPRSVTQVITSTPQAISGAAPWFQFRVADFDSFDLGFENPELYSLRDMRKHADGAFHLGGQTISNACLSYLKVIQDRWREATNPIPTLDQGQSRDACDSYARLEDLIEQLLGSRIGRDIDGRPILYGKPIFEAGLSAGQQALLQWAVSLHAQGTELRSAIITIDEPENHLHPDAQIETVGRIIRANDDGQVWIGTHSLPLVAALHSQFANELSLYYMESGRLSFAGRDPEKILVSLMGGDANVAALREFIDFPDMLATNRFAAECLAPSNVVAEGKPDDPQNAVILNEIMDRSGTPATRKVLDFGAGHARLLNGIAGLFENKTSQHFDYVAWDRPGSTQSSECRCVLERCYQDAGNRWFNDRDQLSAKHNSGSFDCVVMCNVLHEIDPKDWLSLFEPNGIICRWLSPQGQLLIVEDYLMPQGEYAHPYGFIVLGTDSLKALFQIDGAMTGIKVLDAEGKYAGRIKAHIISRELIPNVTAQSRKQALELVARNATEQITKLRESSDHDFRSGQAHAFWVQQFANATLACKSL